MRDDFKNGWPVISFSGSCWKGPARPYHQVAGGGILELVVREAARDASIGEMEELLKEEGLYELVSLQQAVRFVSAKPKGVARNPKELVGKGVKIEYLHGEFEIAQIPPTGVVPKGTLCLLVLAPRRLSLRDESADPEK